VSARVCGGEGGGKGHPCTEREHTSERQSELTYSTVIGACACAYAHIHKRARGKIARVERERSSEQGRQ